MIIIAGVSQLPPRRSSAVYSTKPQTKRGYWGPAWRMICSERLQPPASRPSIWLRCVFSQTPAKVDFARDVQPIFRQNCIGCHGPTKQNNGLRLDRRSSVMKPGSGG